MVDEREGQGAMVGEGFDELAPPVKEAEPSPSASAGATQGEDPEAPWGRTADGTPRRKPGPRKRPVRASSSSGGSVAPPARPKAPKAPSRPAPARPGAKGRDAYKRSTAGLLQMGGAMLALFGQRSPVFLADAAAVAAFTPELSEAVADTAMVEPKVAAVLDRLAAVGPYGAILTVLSGLGAQLAANHGAIPPGMLGTRPPQALIRQAQEEAEAARRALEEELEFYAELERQEAAEREQAQQAQQV